MTSAQARMRERAAAIADASAAEYREFARLAESMGFYRLAGEQHGAANDAERLAVLIRALPLEDDDGLPKQRRRKGQKA